MNELANYPSIIKFSLEWGDMDACGILNNVKYFRYFENGRIDYLEKVGLFGGEMGNDRELVVAVSSAEYKKPLVYPDTITVGTRIKKVGKTSLVMESLLVSESQEIAASGEVVLVMYDFKNKHKIDIPKEAIVLINEIEKIGV